MAESVRPRPGVLLAPGAYDRAFYSGMAITMAAAVLVGFGPTFYFRAFFGAPATVAGSTTLTPLTVLHGVLFTAWVMLFIAQTALVSARRVALHRRLGVAGAALAASMVVAGLSTAFAAARRGAGPPGVEPLAFLAVPFFDMLLFTGFVGSALWLRRNKEAHKRLMLLAYISIVVAAIARFPGVITYGPPGFFALSFVFLLAAIVYDVASRGRVHPVYVWGGALLVVSVPLRLALSGTAAWRAFAEFMVG